MAQSIHDRVEEDRKESLPTAKDTSIFRDYYEGRHKSTLTTEQQRILRSLTGNLYCDNLCAKVVNEAANRLELVGFTVDNDAVSEYLEQLAIRNHLEDFSWDVHLAVLRGWQQWRVDAMA